jgi:hypothetical protein
MCNNIRESEIFMLYRDGSDSRLAASTGAAAVVIASAVAGLQPPWAFQIMNSAVLAAGFGMAGLPFSGPKGQRLTCGAISQVPLNATTVYTAFLATLHYNNPHRVSSLFDCREKPSRPDGLLDEAVYVADNGLVYP